MPFSDWADNQTLDSWFGDGSPATWYLALLESAWAKGQTGATIDEPDGTEYVNYARAAITNNTTNFPAAVNRVKTLVTQVNFAASGGSSTGFTATHWALVDALTLGTGNVITGGALPASVAIAAGITPFLPANALTITAD